MLALLLGAIAAAGTTTLQTAAAAATKPVASGCAACPSAPPAHQTSEV
jgi:hypothetical protein